MAHILIADDDPVVRHILSALLRGFGHEVSTAETGQQCLTMLGESSKSGSLPNVIFLDMFFPDMSGIDILSSVRTSHSRKELPVVMLSANSRDEAIRLAPNVADEEYLSKPFQPDLVREVLERLL